MMYIIFASYGEYDDHQINPLFVSRTEDEAKLFVNALNEKDAYVWNKVVAEFGGTNYVPKDISFDYKPAIVLSI